MTDGEYEITGRWILASNEEVIATASRRVVVKGADAGGIELKFLPMASITGKFAIEATPGVCESKRKWSLEYAPHPLQPTTAAAGCERQKSERDVFSHLMHILF